MAARMRPLVLSIVLGGVCQATFQSPHVIAHALQGYAGVEQPLSHRTYAGAGTIAGVVVNERREPVARTQVHAFSVSARPSHVERGEEVPFSTRGSAHAATDLDGRFQLSELDAGEYLVVAQPVPSLTSGALKQTRIYATTFYPSAVDYQGATRVLVETRKTTPLEIQLVDVPGVRLAGSVVSRSGQPTGGMHVRLFHQVGGFGSESTVAQVGADGTFEITGIPPGWYRLTIAREPAASLDDDAEFATRLIEVEGRDIDALSLTVSKGASLAGRVAAEPGSGVESAVGLQVRAAPAADQYSVPRLIAATVRSDWTFRLNVPPGSYRVNVGAERPPFVTATRITVDGVDAAAERVELTEGPHEVVAFVAPIEARAPVFDTTLSPAALVERFKTEKVFWRQFTIAEEIAARGESTVLSSLEPWLAHEDRHIRGNAAFIFGRFGDPRGFEVIAEILTDHADRREGQGIGIAPGDGRYRVGRQIRSDRYYAAHLMGDLGDPRAVPILVPLLKDKEVRSIVPWALARIGDQRAVGPLLDALDDDDPSMRVLVIYALDTLHAEEAVPRLRSLLDDHRKATFGAQVPVAEAAKAAIARIQGRP
jgi:hypothetical protein